MKGMFRTPHHQTVMWLCKSLRVVVRQFQLQRNCGNNSLIFLAISGQRIVIGTFEKLKGTYEKVFIQFAIQSFNTGQIETRLTIPISAVLCNHETAVKFKRFDRPSSSCHGRPPAALSRCGSINPFLLFRKVKCTRTTSRRRRRRALQKSAKHKAFLEDGAAAAAVEKGIVRRRRRRRRRKRQLQTLPGLG